MPCQAAMAASVVTRKSMSSLPSRSCEQAATTILSADGAVKAPVFSDAGWVDCCERVRLA